MATFPSMVLSSWYDLLSRWRQIGGAAGLAAFQAYLNNGTNPVIRAYVAGSTGSGHQAATANILRRLFMPANDPVLPGFDYQGLVEVYCDGDAALQARFRALLPELQGAGPVYGFYGGTLSTLPYPPVAGAPTVNIGITGGADDDDIHYAATLKTNYFLRLQPYRWSAPQQVQFLSDKWPYVDLEAQKVLGFGTLVERAYAQPVTPLNWAAYAANQRAMIVQWVLAQSAPNVAAFDFMPVYSVRRPGLCEMGTPAQDRIVEICASVMAAQTAAGVAAAPALVLNMDVFEQTDEFSFVRVADMLTGGPTNNELNQGLQPATSPHYNARRVYMQGLNGAGARFDTFVYNPAVQTNLADLQQKVAAWLAGHGDRVLWVQLGRQGDVDSLLPPPVFDRAFSGGTLPGVFEGQNTANLMLNRGRPYFHVNRPGVTNVQYPTTLLGLDGQAAVPRSFQQAADQLRLPLGQWPLNAADNPAVQTGNFIRALQAPPPNALTTYLGNIQAFYGNQVNDKLGLVLTFYNYLINGQPAARAALGVGDAGDTLAGLYENFSTASSPVQFAAQLDPAGQISKFVVDMQGFYPNAPLTLSNVTVTRDPPTGDVIDVVTVVGNTDLFGVPNQVTAVFTAPDGPVTLSCQFMGLLSWSPDGVPWMGFSNPYIGFDVADADLPVTGVLGGTLNGPDITFEVQLPPSDDQICFTGVFNQPPSIAAFYAMVGGVNLVATLPPPLNVVAALELKDVRFAYDSANSVVSTFAFDLGWSSDGGAGMPLLPGLTLDSVDIVLTVTQPGRAASLQAKLSSSFTIGTGPDAGVVSIGALVPAMVFQGELTSGVITLQDLLGMFLPGYELIPPSAPTITQFSFSCNQPTGAYAVSCQLGFDWTISLLGTPVLTLEEIGLLADYADGALTGKLSGSVTLLPKDPLNNLTLLLAADYLGKANWRFSGQQDPDQDQILSLNNLVKTYLGDDWAVPGGDYGINGLGFSAAPTTQTYTITGKTADPWVVPFLPGLTISAAMDLKYAPSVVDIKSGPVLSGELSAVIDWYSVELALAWKFGEDGAYTYVLDWGMLHAEVAQNAKQEWVATGSLPNQTLGSVIEQFVSFATGSAFGLTAPWDLLNSVPLGVFEVTFNFTTKTMGLNVGIGPIDLGFCTIDSIGVVYDPAGADRKVKISLVGSFAWTDDSSLDWDAAKPETAPAPPGGGDKYIDLRLLALGQHIGLVGSPDMTTVSAAINALRNLDADSAPVSGPNTQVYFDPAVSWLVGMDFGLLRVDDDPKTDGAEGEGDDAPTYTLQLSTVFDDPLLYGLRVALDGPAAKVLAGLSFEIMYRRISDTVGVYQAELSLPTAMRTIDVGAYSLTFPTFALAVYTNGDFLADIGFPWNLDFSRSFTVQAIIPPGIPVLGSAGIYFGKLSSATTNKVPAAINGQFNPVIVFGFGAQVGFGKEVDYGLLSAGFSLTVFGVIEGVIAKWCPNQPDGSGANTLQLQSSYYFWLQGSFGIIGRLYGSVDFAVVKASVDIRIVVMAQITYESYQDIPISVIASVDVRASLEIDLGLFSITLHFSFSLTIKETFTIANPDHNPPWQLASPTARLRNDRRTRRLRSHVAMPMLAGSPSWSNLLPATTPAGLTAWLAPALTVSGEGAATAAQQTTAYVAMVALQSVDPSVQRAAGDPDTSFELLAKQVLRWMVASIQSAPLTSAQVDTTIVTDDQLLALSTALTDPGDPVPIPVSAIETFMQGQFRLDISTAGSGQVNATPFPMPPELTLTVPAYNGSPDLKYSFADFNSTSSTYLGELRTYFDALAVLVQPPKSPPQAQALTENPGPSVASFLFADQYRLIAQQMIEGCRTALRDFTYPLVTNQTSQNVVDWVNTTGGLAGDAAYTGAELFAANAAAPLTVGRGLGVAGVTLSAPSGATFTTLAAGLGNGVTPTALATDNAAATELLKAGALVAYPGQTDYVVQPRDTLTLVAAAFSVSLADLLSNSSVLTQEGLIVPLSVLAVPPITYAVAGGDTLTKIAQRFGVTVEALATAANLGVTDLFAGAGTASISIPHLPQFQVGALIDEVQGTGQIAQLAGMTGRYTLHGLRLPTDGVTPIPPAADPLSPDCPVFILSGQQFTIPALVATAFSFSLSRPSSVGWLTLGGGDSLTFTMGELQTSQTKALQSFLTGSSYVFAPPGASIKAEAVFSDAFTSWSVGAPTAWASAGTIALPYGPPVQGEVSLRLWPLPDSLVDLYDETRDAPPRVTPVLGVYDEASGAMVEQDIGAYAWAMQVGVTVKRRLAAGTTTGETTYELVGVGESQITLLERFLSWTKGSSSGVSGFDLLYPGQPAAGASGLQSGDASTLTWGIIQVNLSTVTNPPAGVGDALPEALAAAPPGACFNTAYDFVKLLWECSITRSGGFYLYFCDDVTSVGLPDAAFDDKGEAVLSLVLRTSAPADQQARNLLPGFINAMVTGVPFETGNASVMARAAPIGTTMPAGADDSLSSLGVRTYTDPLVLAEDNAQSPPLATGAGLTVSRGLYVVGPAGAQPGGAVADIADWFGVTVASLEAANPQVTDWTSPQSPGTALFLPRIDLVVGTSKGGTSLASLGDYYGCGVDGLAADNQTRAGIFAGATLSIRGGPSTRTANTPAGSVTIEATRAAPDPTPAPTDPAFAQLFLQANFTLLGYGLEANAWFGASPPGLPISSSDTPETADRRRLPQASAGEPLNYSRVVPVSRYGPVPVATLAATPDPVESPYRGIGGIAQLDLYWLDNFGNRIIGGLGETPSGDPTQPPALPLLYTDPLIGLGQWSGVAAAYAVTGDPGAASLTLTLSFDPTVYSPSTPGWQDRAGQALGLYAGLYYQLAADFVATLTTSLLATPEIAFTAAQVGGLQSWLYGADGVYAYLALQAGGGGGIPPADLPLTFPLATAALNADELFEVTVSVGFSRPSARVAAPFLDGGGVAAVSTTIAPLYAKDPAAGGDRTLNAFAAGLEKAVSAPGQVLAKLATGIDRREAVQTTRSLWLTRLAPGAGLPPQADAVGFEIANAGDPVIYAPRPLYNTLQSPGDVPIYDYVSGVGIDFDTASRTLTFGGVDADVWMGQMLDAVDTVLGPDLSASAALVDLRCGSHHLADLLAAKEQLAGVLSALMIAVFDGESPTPAFIATAQEAFRQQLLQTLSSFYSVSAAIQFEADVVADISDPPFNTVPPSLYGSLVPAQGAPVSDPGVSLTTAKLALATTPAGEPASLTFLASSRNGRDAAGALEKSATLNLVYGGLQIEHQIGQLPNIEGYLASTWLSFVLPPQAGDANWPLAAALGQFEIPLVLRAWPTPPTMASQAAQQVLTGSEGATSLDQAVLWNYSFVFSQAFHYPQDAVNFVSTFNAFTSYGDNSLLGARDLVSDLAEFVTVYPDVAADLTGVLALVDNTTVDPKVLNVAAIALQSFVQLVGRVAEAFGTMSLRARPRLGAGPGQEPYAFSLSEDHINETDPDEKPVEALLVTLTGRPPAGIGDPTVEIEGYVAQRSSTSAGYTFTYVDGAGYYLTAVAGQTIAKRTISMPNLNILSAQNAITSAAILRNQNLVDGKTTAEPFVYQTSPVSFATPLRPTLSVLDPIDIAAIPTGDPVARPLADQLAGLFNALFAEAPDGPQQVQATVSYSITLNPALDSVPLPVVFLPPTGFQPAAIEDQDGDPVSQGQLIKLICDAINAWYGANLPQQGGRLVFDLKVMARQIGGSGETPPTPLLDLTSLYLEFADWSDPPA